MKIKRFVAPTMRAALDLVRTEQGPDAVIVANRAVAGGVELIAAEDYDAALVADALQRALPRERAAERTAAVRPLAPAPAPAVEPAAGVSGFHALLSRVTGGGARGTPAPAANPPTPAEFPPAAPAAAEAAPTERKRRRARPRMVWSQDPGIVAMRREIEGLRQLLEEQLAHFHWDDAERRDPVRARVLRDLASLDIAPDLARRIVTELPPALQPADVTRTVLALLVRHLPVSEDGLLEKGGNFALLGPTGAGKTTTIAKLAAHYSTRHGAGSVGLISMDNYRIGAREQLLAYARMLGVPMHVAGSAAELAAALAAFAGRGLVLVDTAGIGQRDLRLQEQFSLLASQAQQLRPVLVLPSNADQAALDDIIRAHAPIGPAACVLTKIDEAASLGAALSAAMRARLPIAHLCDGQRVPDDLHSARARKVWLVKLAVKLRQRSGRSADDAWLARHFGRAVPA